VAARAASTVTAVAPTGLGGGSRPAAAVAPAPAPGGLLAAGVADLPAMKEAPSAAALSASLEACRDSYQGKRWRAAAAACATAFTAQPDDAKLALRVAEAEYARDHLSEAREWAQRTLELDAKQADALAILGRSEQRTGHPDAAARAFRRYLALAPRGWHASEARATLRGAHPGARQPVQTAPVATRAGQPRERDDSAALPAAAPEQAATAPAPLTAPAPEPTP
jgi:tetratricopeptide (TPR) repeat protein